MNKPIVELKDARKTYTRGKETIHAVDGIDMSVGSGDMLSIVGPSGSGKTTLLNIIGCIDNLSGGTLTLEGQNITAHRESELVKYRRKTIGFVFQQFFLIPTLTARENVSVPGLFSGLKERDRRADELLEMVGMGRRKDHFPSQLSGGEMQRVAIARSLINSPKLLLADEPTGNLDSKNAGQIFSLFRELNRSGLSIVIVTHNNELAKLTRRMVQIHDGKVISDAKHAK